MSVVFRHLCLLLSLGLAPLPGMAMAQAPAPLKTGQPFREALEAQVGITWSSNPLRSALATLSARQQVAIVLDRRVDPDQTIEFSVSEVSLDVALRQLASRLKLGMTVFDSTVYIGPEYAAKRISTMAALAHERALQAPPEVRRKLAGLPALETEALSTPRDLLEAWSAATGLKLGGLDQVPHDLWPALRLPAQTAASRAVILLAGFDLTIEWSSDGTAARIIRLPDKIPLIERSYPGGPTAKQREAQLAKTFPDAEIVLEGAKLRVRASLADHDHIARLLRGEKITRREVRQGDKRYTLNVENQPVGAVAAAIAKRVDMEIVIEPAAAEKAQERVSFKVEEATLEELLKKMLEPAGLKYEIKEKVIRIDAKE